MQSKKEFRGRHKRFRIYGERCATFEAYIKWPAQRKVESASPKQSN